MKIKWVGAMLLCVVLIGIYFTSDEPSDDSEDIPRGMFGKWETTNSRYEDRYFSLSPDKIIFGVGEDEELVYALTGIRKINEAGQALFTATFEDNDGNSYDRSFYYEDTPRQVIRFKNQNEIKWRKTDPMDE